ncbi:MAG: 5-formyltetrahydrofolate cyclo-ligase [Bacteroidota bacterium]|jgi:5-formyltetrahydrofolate cyclo-ligase
MIKKEARELYIQKRMELAPGELEARSELISGLLFKHFQLSEKTISIFLPMERKKEINTYLVLEKGYSLDAKVALPKMNEDTQTLRHFLFENHAQLEVNRLGIPEPRSGKSVKLKDLEYVLVPLLAFDDKGHRVGYGKGYYDRFLKKCAPGCIFIGLSLFEESIVIDDIETHDVRLHYCITPTRLIRFEE